MKRKYQVIGIFILLLCSVIYDFPRTTQETIETEPLSYVTLEGAFLKNGEYEFTGHKYVRDIVLEVGVKDNANLNALSLEQEVIDESRLYLPLQQGTCISLNHASQEELMTLKGLGEKTAQKIIDYRQNQPFLRLEDIMNISGIGEKTYLRLRDSLCL